MVLGGSSLIARYLLPRLLDASGAITVLARGPVAVPDTCVTQPFEDLRSGRWELPADASVLSLLPLPVLIPLLDHLRGAGRVVALGSTSVFSKAASRDPGEARHAGALQAAEAALAAWSHANGIPSTLLRPTLVYDGRGDKNIARMAAFVRRWGVLPLARPATGLRQPIHAEDVAVAMLRALATASLPHRAFTIAGSERLSYRAMAERVFRSLGRSPRLLMLPVGLLEAAFSTASRLRLLNETAFGGSVFARMNEDLVYDIGPGLDALDYRPRPFDPQPERT